MNVRLQLFTVPGQVYYAATRRLVLSGADGIVFVADSQSGRMEANLESLEDLNANLSEHNRPLAQISHTFQWNKRDLPDATSLEELERKCNIHGAPSIGTVATQGQGVFDGLEQITRLVLRAYEAELPKSERSLETRHDSSDESGIADAIRGLAESSERRVITPVAGIPKLSTTPPSVGPAPAVPEIPLSGIASPGSVAPPPATGTATPLAPSPAAPSPSLEALHSALEMEELPTVALAGELLRPAPKPPPEQPAEPRAPAPGPPFSLAELWGEGERETAREVEASLAGRDIARAVLACDNLVTRVLASAAGLAGSADAPRDPGSVALMLGLEGRRYLAFRAIVRAVRLSDDIRPRDALECYAFALEVRRAREAIGR